MATIRKIGDKWQVMIRRKGHKTISRVFLKKSLAERWSAKIESEVLEKINAFKDARELSVPLHHSMPPCIPYEGNELRETDWEGGLWFQFIGTTKYRAAKKEIEFTLDRSEYSELVRRANNRCEITGIPFNSWSPNSHVESKKHPFRPTIDRIDSRIGYTKENCRIVCYIANLAMSHWGEAALLALIYGFVDNKNSDKAM